MGRTNFAIFPVYKFCTRELFRCGRSKSLRHTRTYTHTHRHTYTRVQSERRIGEDSEKHRWLIIVRDDNFSIYKLSIDKIKFKRDGNN